MSRLDRRGGSRWWAKAAAILGCLFVDQASLALAEEALPGDAAHGAILYQTCMGCHAVDQNDVGPRHRGVVGRLAGSVPGYAYSPALRQSGLTWTPGNLDRWLADPQRLVPGAKMYFSLSNEQDRADIIAYLAQQR